MSSFAGVLYVPFIVLPTHAVHRHILYSSPHRIPKPQSNPIRIRIAMKPRPLLPLYDNESPEEEEARKRAKELQDAQPSPHDNPCTSLSKWLARNSRAVNRFGLAAAIVLGMKAISTTSLFEADVLDLSIESEYGVPADQREFILSDQNDENVNQSGESRRQLTVRPPARPPPPIPSAVTVAPPPIPSAVTVAPPPRSSIQRPRGGVTTAAPPPAAPAPSIAVSEDSTTPPPARPASASSNAISEDQLPVPERDHEDQMTTEVSDAIIARLISSPSNHFTLLVETTTQQNLQEMSPLKLINADEGLQTTFEPYVVPIPDDLVPRIIAEITHFFTDITITEELDGWDIRMMPEKPREETPSADASS